MLVFLAEWGDKSQLSTIGERTQHMIKTLDRVAHLCHLWGSRSGL